jgi:hypothetical protein
LVDILVTETLIERLARPTRQHFCHLTARMTLMGYLLERSYERGFHRSSTLQTLTKGTNRGDAVLARSLALTRRAHRLAIRIRWVLSSSPSLPS